MTNAPKHVHVHDLLFPNGIMSSEAVSRGENYAAWIAGLATLSEEYGTGLCLSGARRLASPKEVSLLLSSGVDPDRIVALYILCFGALPGPYI